MSSTALYTNLSNYYDLLCTDINYQEQSEYVRRAHQLFGNGGKHYLDLACGTGPHVKHFIDFGYQANGLDINQPMLDIAQARCPEAKFIQQDMSNFKASHFNAPEQFDLISCFLYSIHYNDGIHKLKKCIASAHAALKPGGVFCFNAVDKNTIDNKKGITHTLKHHDSDFAFQSSWYYCGQGDQQALHITIKKTTIENTEFWQDQHQMVAISFQHLQELLQPYFAVHIFEHVFDRIVPWDESSGNAIFVAIKT
jgi:SAM-dependent methyltransferase